LKFQLAVLVLVVGPSGLIRQVLADDAQNAVAPAPGIKQEFAFDVPDGKYDSYESVVPPEANAFHAKISFIRLGKPTTPWKPEVGVAAGSGRYWVVLHVFARDFHLPFGAVLFLADGRSRKSVVQYSSEIGLHPSVAFNWTSDGWVTATVDSETHSLFLGTTVKALRIEGSTGAGRFTEMSVGKTTADTHPHGGCTPVANQEIPTRTQIARAAIHLFPTEHKPAFFSVGRHGYRWRSGAIFGRVFGEGEVTL